jgi:hypothetical protein
MAFGIFNASSRVFFGNDQVVTLDAAILLFNLAAFGLRGFSVSGSAISARLQQTLSRGQQHSGRHAFIDTCPFALLLGPLNALQSNCAHVLALVGPLGPQSYPGAIYHILNRGDRREYIFHKDQAREVFSKALEEMCGKTGWQMHAYCLMKNHFHLVIEFH